MATADPRGGALDAAELARRLNLLLDFEEAQRGAPVPFAAVEEYVAAQGGSLSRAKWTYMLSGDGRRNRDTGLLRLLAGSSRSTSASCSRTATSPSASAPSSRSSGPCGRRA